MIIRYTRHQSPMKFSLLVAGIEACYENMFHIVNSSKDDSVLDSSEKAKLFDRTKKLTEDTETLSDELFNNDTELIGEADEVNEEEMGKITSYPEWISKQRQEKSELQG